MRIARPTSAQFRGLVLFENARPRQGVRAASCIATLSSAPVCAVSALPHARGTGLTTCWAQFAFGCLRQHGVLGVYLWKEAASAPHQRDYSCRNGGTACTPVDIVTCVRALPVDVPQVWLVDLRIVDPPKSKTAHEAPMGST